MYSVYKVEQVNNYDFKSVVPFQSHGAFKSFLNTSSASCAAFYFESVWLNFSLLLFKLELKYSEHQNLSK